MRNFRRKVAAAAAFIKLGARRRALPATVSGLHAYRLELLAIVDETRAFVIAGQPVRIPQVELPRGPVTLLDVETLERMLPSMDREMAVSMKAELAERRQGIKRDGHDTMLRAALIQKYGLRITGGS